jgi:hypothetical protein
MESAVVTPGGGGGLWTQRDDRKKVWAASNFIPSMRQKLHVYTVHCVQSAFLYLMVSKFKIFSYLVEKSNNKVYDYLPILKIIFRGLKGEILTLKHLQKAANNP